MCYCRPHLCWERLWRRTGTIHTHSSWHTNWQWHKGTRTKVGHCPTWLQHSTAHTTYHTPHTKLHTPANQHTSTSHTTHQHTTHHIPHTQHQHTSTSHITTHHAHILTLLQCTNAYTCCMHSIPLPTLCTAHHSFTSASGKNRVYDIMYMQSKLACYPPPFCPLLIHSSSTPSPLLLPSPSSLQTL